MLDKFYKKYLDIPSALGVMAWKEWDKKTKKDHPIVYFFYNDVDKFFGQFYTRFQRWVWRLKHEYIRKHQHHLVDTGLEPNYYDPDTQIREVIFSRVDEYVKKNHFIWDEDLRRCDIRIMLQNVSDWHLIYKPKLEKRIEDLYEMYGDTQKVSYFDCGSFSPDDRRSKLIGYLEAKILRIDKKMMVLVINDIESMWY